ncbi:hypothetical protein Zm00014a_032309 [Zea mays]|uniref:Uncharacterized protein n=1 Tax=Zea mays TaxID=4577 RepID=A0A3L6DJ51_MAIZE|nr:hypothetical protein Zm00014a_032309 [Zea mays]
MVPTKRKRSTGAAVVATVVKWKVGDLVLTKMKSFPAWLAMAGVSHLGFGGSLGRLVKANQLPVANMIGYLEAKNHLLLGYCQDIVYYLLRKAKGLSVDGHPIACLLELLLQPSVSSLPYVD